MSSLYWTFVSQIYKSGTLVMVLVSERLCFVSLGGVFRSLPTARVEASVGGAWSCLCFGVVVFNLCSGLAFLSTALFCGTLSPEVHFHGVSSVAGRLPFAVEKPSSCSKRWSAWTVVAFRESPEFYFHVHGGAFGVHPSQYRGLLLQTSIGCSFFLIAGTRTTFHGGYSSTELCSCVGEHALAFGPLGFRYDSVGLLFFQPCAYLSVKITSVRSSSRTSYSDDGM
ncbi:unnamed protein product [Eruca vesicaria subsp. sativa]|uniref:Uncharacterized protein n=1 Tax=Eruca vesicaria subsp. sativa TaxID=29727 RepID=A0ABC8K9K7_ERUVS|nr:unnamed protein product [Eruca vesicaria subsp. sativa]